MFNFRSVVFKLWLSLLLFFIAAGAVSLYFYSENVRQQLLEKGQQNLRAVALHNAAQLNTVFMRQQQNLRDNAAVFSQQIKTHDIEDAWQFVTPGLDDERAVSFYYDRNEHVLGTPEVWQNNTRITLDLDNNMIFSLVSEFPKEQTDGRWSRVYFDDVLLKWLVSYALPIFSGDEFTGVFGGGIEVDPVIDEISQQYQGTGVHFFIYDTDGNIVFHPDYGESLIRQPESLSTGNNSYLLRQSLVDFIHVDSPFGEVSQFKDYNKLVYAVSQPIPSNHWILVSYQNKTDMIKGWSNSLIDGILFLLIWLVLTWVMLMGFGKYVFINRIRHSQRALKNAMDDHYDVSFPRNGNDEISELNEQIGKLFQRFKSRIKEKDSTIFELKDHVASHKALAQAVSYSDNAVFVLELDYTVSYVDSKALRLLGGEREQLMGQRFFSFIHEHMAFVSEQIVNEIRRKKSWHGELILKNVKSGEQVWVNSTISPMRDDNSTVTKYVLSMQDISFIKDTQSKIEKLSYTDELTSLANRTFFIAQLEKLVEMSKRGRYEFALLYFDIDDFKRVNDVYGHDGGDQLLLEVAARLSDNMRTEDVLARMGGDEFALIVGGVVNEQDVIKVAEQILHIINESFSIRGQEVQTSTSIGITMSIRDEKEPEMLLQHADLAMYEAKGLGKNTYHFYTKELNQVAQERRVIETALQAALREQRLELYYQPKVDTNGNQLVGFEALLRWNDPDLGFVSPAKFIPIAEQSNLILKLGVWVMYEACRFAASLEHQVPVSINLSARQFEAGNFVDDLRETLERTGASPSMIEMEITESHLMTDVEAAIKQLHGIKELGVAISIDDFGTGYSSLSYLKRFPVDTLKIDRSFIKDIPGDINDVEITGAIIAMAQKLGLEVIAEGVETIEQLHFLDLNGCHLIQGYYFSKPLPASEAIVWTPTVQLD